MDQQSSSILAWVFLGVCLGLTFDKLAVEGCFESRRVMTSKFLVDDELGLVRADFEGDQFCGVSKCPC